MLRIEDIHEIYERHNKALNTKVEEFTIGDHHFDFNSNPEILGVLNLSKDSTYRGSVCFNPEQAIQRGQVLRAQGAALVDIGAESTVAKKRRVDELEQNSQLLPVIKGLSQAGVLTSIETYYPEVVRACLNAGANVINLTGATDTTEIYRLVSEFDAGIIICYVHGKNVRELSKLPWEDDATQFQVVYEYLAREIEAATKLGVRKIFVDAGLGYSNKHLLDSSQCIRYKMYTCLNTFRFRTLGFPVCHAMPDAVECFREEVRSGEAFFSVLAALGQTDLFRTHEVQKIKAVLDTLDLFSGVIRLKEWGGVLLECKQVMLSDR